jgi:mannosyltransferase OCH1-like enzyme
MIPKIIHQIWLGPPISTELSDYISQWRVMYPDYIHILWNEDLVDKTNIIYGDIKKYYSGDYHPVFKSDILRFKILQNIGGIYIDTDFQPLKRFDESILEYEFFSAIQNNNEVATGFMGSVPDGEFITNTNKSLYCNIPNFSVSQWSNEIHKVSGPEWFDKFCRSFDFNNPRYKFFDPKYFYPYSWLEKELKNTDWRIHSPESYAVHHWKGSWCNNQ